MVGGDIICDPGWEGIACDNKLCESDCHGFGKCLNGTCLCNEGYIGGACEI
jgi:syndecan 4